MDLYTINYIKNNNRIYNYLREEPKYYKELNRNKDNIKIVEKIIKEQENKRTIDKINTIKDKIDLFTSFIDVLK